jgi:hypothetical protein
MLVDDQVAQLGVDLAREPWSLELPHRPHNLLAVGQEPVSARAFRVRAEDDAERIGHSRGIEELVLDHVDALWNAAIDANEGRRSCPAIEAWNHAAKCRLRDPGPRRLLRRCLSPLGSRY